MKQLPYIAIEGVGKTKEEVLDSLIAIEPLLVMMGYSEPYEQWNNEFCEKCNNSWQHSILHLDNAEKKLEYHNHSAYTTLRFKSTEIKKLIKYMTKEGYIK